MAPITAPPPGSADLLSPPAPHESGDKPATEAQAAADKAAADKAAADKAAADKAAADKAAAEPKAKRARRGPPPAGEAEETVVVLLTTSRFMGADGRSLRRGRPVRVPARRLTRLIAAGKVKQPSKVLLDRAIAQFGEPVDLA